MPDSPQQQIAENVPEIEGPTKGQGFKFSKKRKFEASLTLSEVGGVSTSCSNSDRAAEQANLKRPKLNKKLNFFDIIDDLKGAKTSKVDLSEHEIQRGQTSKAFSDLLLCQLFKPACFCTRRE